MTRSRARVARRRAQASGEFNHTDDDGGGTTPISNGETFMNCFWWSFVTLTTVGCARAAPRPRDDHTACAGGGTTTERASHASRRNA